jgi:hypothetical protein
MTFPELLSIVGSEPVFESSLLLAGNVQAPAVQQQLSRWVRAGRLQCLRRGLYSLAPPYRKVVPHPFVVSNALFPGSYVSCQSALSHYGMIPEHVPVATSVGPGRPREVATPAGRYAHQFLAPRLRWGSREEVLGHGQHARVALPEKALLDLLHLTPRCDDPPYLDELRLQRLGVLDGESLLAAAERTGEPRLRRASVYVLDLAAREAREEPAE